MNNIYNFFFNENVKNPNFLIFFRISIGFVLCIYICSIWNDFHYLYGQNPIIPRELGRITHDNSLNFIEYIYHYSNSIGFLSKRSHYIILFIILILSFCIIFGFFPRINAFLLILIFASIHSSGFDYRYGFDYFMNMSLLYIILLPSGKYYSISKLTIKLNNLFSNLTPIRRLFQIHICILYFFSGLTKSLGYNWWNGFSIWKSIHLPSVYVNTKLDFLHEYPIILSFIGWSTVIIELFYPIFININKTRITWLTLTILLHIGIAVTLNLFLFSAIMIIWNITNYYFKDY